MYCINSINIYSSLKDSESTSLNLGHLKSHSESLLGYLKVIRGDSPSDLKRPEEAPRETFSKRKEAVAEFRREGGLNEP